MFDAESIDKRGSAASEVRHERRSPPPGFRRGRTHVKRHHGLVINGLCSTFMSRKVHAGLAENGRNLQQVAAGPV